MSARDTAPKLLVAAMIPLAVLGIVQIVGLDAPPSAGHTISQPIVHATPHYSVVPPHYSVPPRPPAPMPSPVPADPCANGACQATA